MACGRRACRDVDGGRDRLVADESVVGVGGFANPLAVPGLQPVDAFVDGLSSATSVLAFGSAAAALWIRYRRGNPVERQQLKWLLALAALAAVFLPTAFIMPNQDVADVAFILGALTLVALPVAIAVAILRYRLYEIDRIISRTIAYTSVTLLLLGVFGAAVVLFSAALASFASGQTIAVAGPRSSPTPCSNRSCGASGGTSTAASTGPATTASGPPRRSPSGFATGPTSRP